MRKQKLWAFIMAGCMALAAAGCGKEASSPTAPSQTGQVVTLAPTTQAETKTGTKEETTDGETKEQLPEGMQYSFLTGELVSIEQAQRRPVALMIGNTQAALPQYGLSKAGVIYEAPAEGGINRLMPVFEDYSGLDRIGSLRSARTYFCFFSKEFDAVLGHFGEAFYAQPYLNSPGFEHFDCLSDSGSELFFRTSDRQSPHNAFTSGERIDASMEKNGFSTTYPGDYTGHFQFVKNSESPVDLKGGADAVLVNPNYPVNEPWFEYDAASGLYKRFQYGEAHMDAAVNQQLAVKNIIIQSCNMTHYDDTPYLNFDVQSGGNGYFITEGKAVPVTWTKDSEWGQTHYFGADGKEIRLNQGRTWVCIVQSDRFGGVHFQ